jgi:excisionase family DNA binding protein
MTDIDTERATLLARLRAAHPDRKPVDIDGTLARWQARCAADHARFEREYRERHADDVVEEDTETPERKRKPLAIPDNVTPELLTIDQAAVYLNITDEQVSAFIADGSLDYINVGRGSTRPRIRFTKQDLDAFIDRRRQREAACPSTKSRTRRTTTSTSNSVVVGFVDRRNAQRAAKPKPSKP